MFSKKTTKFDKIFTVDLTITTYCEIDGEDFVNFCGLLRKHELYKQQSQLQIAWIFLLLLSWFLYKSKQITRQVKKLKIHSGANLMSLFKSTLFCSQSKTFLFFYPIQIKLQKIKTQMSKTRKVKLSSIHTILSQKSK